MTVPLCLALQDWTSGDIPWLVLSVPPKELLTKLEGKLREGMGDKMRVLEPKKRPSKEQQA